MVRKSPKVKVPTQLIIVSAVVILAVAVILMTSKGPSGAPSCGDNVCNAEESCSSCPADCGVCPSCGDGACNGNEACLTCPRDCTQCTLATITAIEANLPPALCNDSDGVLHQAALETGNVEYCMCIKDEITKGQCNSVVLDNKYYSLGVNTYDIRSCELISNPYAKESCSSIVTSALDTLADEDPMYFAILFTSTQNYEQAVPILEAQLANDPQNYGVLLALGQMYSTKVWGEQSAGPNAEKAMGYIDRALAINPNSVAGYRLRGYLYEAQGKPDLAIASYNKSVQLNSQYILGYDGMGHAYRVKGDYVNAILSLRKAKALDTKREHLKIYASLCTMESSIQELIEEAMADCQIVINSTFETAINEKNSAYSVMGYLYMRVGQYDDALANFQTALTYLPNDPGAYVYIAELYNHKGNYTKAEETALKAIELNETKTNAYMELSFSLYKQGKYNEAIQAALNGIEMADKDPTLLAMTRPIATGNLYYNLANIYNATGDTANEMKYKGLGDAEYAKIGELTGS